MTDRQFFALLVAVIYARGEGGFANAITAAQKLLEAIDAQVVRDPNLLPSLLTWGQGRQ